MTWPAPGARRATGTCIWYYTLDHLRITLLALALGTVVAFPLGLLGYRWRNSYPPILRVSNTLYSVPSLALHHAPRRASAVPLRRPADRHAGDLHPRHPRAEHRRRASAPCPRRRERRLGVGYTPPGGSSPSSCRSPCPPIIAGFRVATVSTVSLVTVGGASASAGSATSSPTASSEQDGGQEQRRRPALGVVDEGEQVGVFDLEAGGGQQPSRLVGGHLQVVGPELEQPARRAQAPEAERRLGPRCERDLQVRAAGLDQLREDPDRVRRAQRVDVIEHEEPVAADRVERRGMGAQRRRQPREVDARGDRAGRGRVQLLVLRGPWRSELPEGVGEPLEQDLGVVVERCQREPRDRTALALDPVGEQRRLP